MKSEVYHQEWHDRVTVRTEVLSLKFNLKCDYTTVANKI